jgi:hypothetical protein
MRTGIRPGRNETETAMAIVRFFPQPRPGAPVGEPGVSDLLDDPVAQAMMRRDGVTREGVLAMLARLQPCIARPAGCAC